MPITPFPDGISSFGMPVLPSLGGLQTTGNVFFVDSNLGNNGNSGKDPIKAVATVDNAVGRCAANKGNLIVCMPGHAESISSATALAMDVAGVTVIGLGVGASRPTFTFTTATTATIAVSAANVKFKNVRFVANFADIVSVFTLTTATDLVLEDCEISASAADVNFLSVVDVSTTDNAADGLTIHNCSWIEPDLATLYMVNGDADIDRMRITNNYVNLGVNTNDEPALVGMATGKDVTNIHVEGNRVIRLNDANPLLIVTDTTTANTGIVARNFVRHADTAGELLVTAATNIGHFENYATAAADASGYILPAVDS